MKKAAIFRHVRYNGVFMGVVGDEVRCCSETEGVLGELSPDDCDRLSALIEHSPTRAQGVSDLAEFFESVMGVTFVEGLILGEIFSMCVENIASALFANGVRYTGN